ncbi:MAG: ArsR family transcriptional regulator [Comamonadaceae bacterium]|nr:MAG: ArsR family transcriptional regulator [Comamonadaceae bacterium]
MPFQATTQDTHKVVKTDETYESAASLFRVMSAPMRLKIINCLCSGEQNVSYLLTQVDTTQPNMSQHLNTLYQAGILGKRRDGVQIFYRIIDPRIVSICEAVCVEVERKNTGKNGL